MSELKDKTPNAKQRIIEGIFVGVIATVVGSLIFWWIIAGRNSEPNVSSNLQANPDPSPRANSSSLNEARPKPAPATPPDVVPAEPKIVKVDADTTNNRVTEEVKPVFKPDLKLMPDQIIDIFNTQTEEAKAAYKSYLYDKKVRWKVKYDSKGETYTGAASNLFVYFTPEHAAKPFQKILVVCVVSANKYPQIFTATQETKLTLEGSIQNIDDIRMVPALVMKECNLTFPDQ